MSATTAKPAPRIRKKKAARKSVPRTGAQRKRFKSDVMAAIHASATALHKVGAMPATTLRNFDVACLAPPSPLEPAEIKRLRERLQVSQPVFAKYLNTTESTIAKWESGAKRPSGLGLKLLNVVKKRGLEALV